jgi:hypothetical protein
MELYGTFNGEDEALTLKHRMESVTVFSDKSTTRNLRGLGSWNRDPHSFVRLPLSKRGNSWAEMYRNRDLDHLCKEEW